MGDGVSRRTPPQVPPGRKCFMDSDGLGIPSERHQRGGPSEDTSAHKSNSNTNALLRLAYCHVFFTTSISVGASDHSSFKQQAKGRSASSILSYINAPFIAIIRFELLIIYVIKFLVLICLHSLLKFQKIREYADDAHKG